MSSINVHVHNTYFICVCVVLLENLPDITTRIQEQPELTLNCAALSLHSVSRVNSCVMQAILYYKPTQIC